MAGLNQRQQKFVQLYLATGNATQSYIDAGYDVDRETAKANAARLLANANVCAVIDAARQKAVEATGITAEWYVERLMLEATREGPGSSHSGRVAALRLAGELIQAGSKQPAAPPEGVTFEFLARIFAALGPVPAPAGEPGGLAQAVDDSLI